MHPEIGSQELVIEGAPASAVSRQRVEVASAATNTGHRVVTRVEAEKPQILWIDDQVSPKDDAVLLLEFEGFRVRCAVTAAGGLAMAQTGQYRGIILDLNLPDMPGLAVLAELRAQSITTPVMILTGFGDFESALVAGRFGVQRFESKPIFDLEVAVKRLIAADSCQNQLQVAVHSESRARFKSLAALLKSLHDLSRESVRRVRDERERVTPDSLEAALARALADPALPIPVFLACAAALRSTMASDRAASPVVRAREAEKLILTTLSRSESRNEHVIRVFEMLQSAATQHARLTLETIAATDRINPAHLGRLVKSETGFEFTDWRIAFLLRPSLKPLLESSENVKQIARARLSYTHESQFDRDFRCFFGLTPTQFRQLCRQHD